jgi:hypothetical protein
MASLFKDITYHNTNFNRKVLNVLSSSQKGYTPTPKMHPKTLTHGSNIDDIHMHVQ